MSNRAWRRRRSVLWLRDHGQWRRRRLDDPSDQHPRWIEPQRERSKAYFDHLVRRQIKRWRKTLDQLHDPPASTEEPPSPARTS